MTRLSRNSLLNFRWLSSPILLSSDYTDWTTWCRNRGTDLLGGQLPLPHHPSFLASWRAHFQFVHLTSIGIWEERWLNTPTIRQNVLNWSITPTVCMKGSLLTRLVNQSALQRCQSSRTLAKKPSILAWDFIIQEASERLATPQSGNLFTLLLFKISSLFLSFFFFWGVLWKRFIDYSRLHVPCFHAWALLYFGLVDWV